MSETENKISDETRNNLKELSKTMLRLHKILLDKAKDEYEAKNGTIQSINQYFQLVLDDPHFAWLRKISSLVSLIDEATSLRRPATESEAQGLINETGILLEFKDSDEDFNDKFQKALQDNPDAVIGYNEALNFIKEGTS